MLRYAFPYKLYAERKTTGVVSETNASENFRNESDYYLLSEDISLARSYIKFGSAAQLTSINPNKMLGFFVWLYGFQHTRVTKMFCFFCCLECPNSINLAQRNVLNTRDIWSDTVKNFSTSYSNYAHIDDGDSASRSEQPI